MHVSDVHDIVYVPKQTKFELFTMDFLSSKGYMRNVNVTFLNRVNLH